MPNPLLDTYFKLKKQAEKAELVLLERLAKSYSVKYAQRVEPQVKALEEQIDALQKAGTLTAAKVKTSTAYRNLVSTVQNELDDYSAYLRTEVASAVTDSASRGVQASETLLKVAVAASLGIEVGNLPKGTILRPNDKTLTFLSQYLDPQGQLFKVINGLSNYHAGQISTGILDMVSHGSNPRVIADWITDTYGMGLTDSMRICRTVQLYSYRQANNETQVANAELLEGVVWCAELDDRTCESCISLHGQVFPVGTVCNDHHNGRCDMIPWVKGMPNPIEQTGEAWFMSQEEGRQRAILGDTKFEAWATGKFEFNKLSSTYEDDVYGEMRRVASLQELIGE